MSSERTTQTESIVKIVRTTSTFDCGGRCPLRLHVKDNRILRVEGDDAAESEQLRTCLRCRALRQYVHHPERLMYPQKRVGKRGEGKFERISWDEAYNTLAGELNRVKETYGNESHLSGHRRRLPGRSAQRRVCGSASPESVRRLPHPLRQYFFGRRRLGLINPVWIRHGRKQPGRLAQFQTHYLVGLGSGPHDFRHQHHVSRYQGQRKRCQNHCCGSQVP